MFIIMLVRHVYIHKWRGLSAVRYYGSVMIANHFLLIPLQRSLLYCLARQLEDVSLYYLIAIEDLAVVTATIAFEEEEYSVFSYSKTVILSLGY